VPKERLNGVNNKDRHHPQPVCGLHGERPQGRRIRLHGRLPLHQPYDDEIDKATYFERCWRATDWIERQDLETIMVEGEAAYVTYRCVARDGKSFRNTECFAFEGDRIRRIDVYFGATYQDGAFVKAQP
jgi:hypothetical protein